MESKLISIQGLSIAYNEINENAPKTIFFIHGNSCSSRIWRKQSESPLLNNYRLVFFDLPAHGNSGSADEPDQVYNFPLLGKIMAAAVLQLAAGKPYIIAAMSMGTNILAEMILHNVDPRGLVLLCPTIAGGEIILGQIAKPGTHVHLIFTDDAEKEDLRNYALEVILSGSAHDLQFFMEDYSAVKKPFRSVLAKSIFNQQYSDEIKILQQKNIPLLMVFGKDEKVVDPDYLDKADLPLWKNTILKIPGASHLVNIDQPEKVNQLIAEFAEDMFK